MSSTVEDARHKLPLKQLMEQHGHGPKNGRWKDFQCPFCQKKTGSGVYAWQGVDLFKCHHSSCPTGTVAMDEVGYLGQVLGLDRKEAFKQYLKMAGVWKEEPYAPSILPGQRARRKPDPVEHAPGTVDSGSDSVISPRLACASDGVAAPENRFPCYGANEGAAHFTVSSGEEDGPPMDHYDSVESAELPADHIPMPEPSHEKNGNGHPGANGKSKSGKSGGGKRDGGSGGNGSSRGDGAGGQPAEDSSEDFAASALAWFYSKLVLTPEDEQALFVKRGLTASTCRALGFKSNQASNQEHLLAMRGVFSDEALVKSGLWMERDGGIKPNQQFWGWGVAGKVQDGERKGEFEWDWVNPILIPYFTEAGKLSHLRPHKGMSEGAPPRLYVARPTHGDHSNYDRVVITEGEFKAAALWQVCGYKVAVAAIPGITMSKHWLVEEEIRKLLKTTKPRTVIVGFDNEEKGDPSLPGYKLDRRKRFDAEIWARYLAEKCRKEGYSGRVVRIPDGWRDAFGKADWDDALARMIKESKASTAQEIKAALDEIGARFYAVLDSALSVEETREARLFVTADEEIIRTGVAKIFYVAKLPIGGDKEFSVAQRLLRAARDLEMTPGQKYTVESLAKIYRETSGRYYNLKPLKDVTREKWEVARGLAWGSQNLDLAWVCQTVLKGFPKVISDFNMKGHFVLVRLDGKRSRIVQLRNVHGEMCDLVPLDAKSLTRPTEFREWLHNCGNYSWKGNETDLQNLHEDMNTAVAFQNVAQVAAFGYDENSKLWFFRDCAIGPDVDSKIVVVKPDEWGIYWHQGVGYMLSDRGKDNQSFRQGMPAMAPEFSLSAADLDFSSFRYGRDLTGGQVPKTDQAWFPVFLREVCERLREGVGGKDAYAAFGVVLAYGAAPELFRRFNSFPGLFIHGQTSSGKTTLSSWHMELWGFMNRESGLGIKSNVTPAGLQIALEQYSNLPLWLDEYESDAAVPEGIKGIIHSSYNREVPSKWAADGNMRVIRTNLIVTGETTPVRAATRSRFTLVQTSAEHRIGTKVEQMENFEWLQKHRSMFFTIGRQVLLQREEYAELVGQFLTSWLKSPEMKNVEERTKVVHGVAYASIMAMVSMWGTHSAVEMAQFKTQLIEHCITAVEAVAVQVNINQFWLDMLAAHKAGVFGDTRSELGRYFTFTKTRVESAPCSPSQLGWYNVKLYINFNAVIPKLREALRRQGRDLPLGAQDLRDQLSMRDYWVQPDSLKQGHKQRFGKGAAVSRCWCIDLDKHELGYCHVTDEELDAAKYNEDGNTRTEWGDPRKGELFDLVESLEKQEPV